VNLETIMRKLHLSTGAWIFAATALLVVALPTGVYAAAKISAVHIEDGAGTTLAAVDPEGQLLSASTSPANTVHVFTTGAGSTVGCHAIYTPPAGEALVVTSLTYDLGSGTAGTEVWGFLYSSSTCATFPVDSADTTQGYDTFQHTFPTGLPVSSLGYYNEKASSSTYVGVTGYLIPASQVPSATPASKTDISKLSK